VPKTKLPVKGLKPWDGIRNPKMLCGLLKMGVASLIWKFNKEKKRAYDPSICSGQFIKAYKIIGASLVRGGYIKSPESIQGQIKETPKGKARVLELKRSNTLDKLEHLKRARLALDYLEEVLPKLKEDLEAGIIKETP